MVIVIIIIIIMIIIIKLTCMMGFLASRVWAYLNRMYSLWQCGRILWAPLHWFLVRGLSGEVLFQSGGCRARLLYIVLCFSSLKGERERGRGERNGERAVRYRSHSMTSNHQPSRSTFPSLSPMREHPTSLQGKGKKTPPQPSV